MSKPPKDCMRAAVRALTARMETLHGYADVGAANVPGLRPEFVDYAVKTVRTHRNNAARLARVIEWLEAEIGDRP